MKVILFVVTLAVWLSACCPERQEPSPPEDAIGWKDFQEGTTMYRGRFLLKKGQSTDNGKVEVKVLELIPPGCASEAASFERLARVRLQFTSVSDHKVLCSEVYGENSGGYLTLDCPAMPQDFGISGIKVSAINLKDRWVFFSLDGYY